MYYHTLNGSEHDLSELGNATQKLLYKLIEGAKKHPLDSLGFISYAKSNFGSLSAIVNEDDENLPKSPVAKTLRLFRDGELSIFGEVYNDLIERCRANNFSDMESICSTRR